MFKSILEKFVAKRIAAFLILFLIVTLFLENRWYIAFGLIVGAALSVLRFAVYGWIFRQITSDKKSSIARSILTFAVNQIMVFPVLFLFYFLNRWLFAGVVAGALLAPVVLIVNSITEVLGITKNDFYL